MEIIGHILAICREPKTFEEILKYLFDEYRLVMDFNQYVLAGSTIRSYLTYLLDDNRLSAEFSENRLKWLSC